MPEFIRIVADMVDNDLLQLWLEEGGDRTEVYEVPEHLGRRYSAIRHDDERFDPFGFSLTIGPKADRDAEPDWEIELQFASGEFVLEAKPGADGEVLRQVARLFPDVRLVVVRTSSDDGHVRIAGRLIAAGDDG